MERVSVYAFADEASPRIDGQIDALRRNGMRGLEIRGVDGQNVSEISLDKAREVRRRLEDAGLVTWSVGSPIGKIDIVKDDYAAHLDVLRHSLDVARELGAENLRLFSFYIPAGEAPERFRDEALARVARMAELCREWGVCPCHENEKGIYGDIAARCLDIHEQIPGLAAVFDPANFIQCGQDTEEAWRLLKPFVKYLHIKDALPDGSVVPAGAGAGQVPEIVADYVASGGAALTVEPHLTVFDGLKRLERAGERSRVEDYVYESPDAAFDAAASALREILNGKTEGMS